MADPFSIAGLTVAGLQTAGGLASLFGGKKQSFNPTVPIYDVPGVGTLGSELTPGNQILTRFSPAPEYTALKSSLLGFNTKLDELLAQTKPGFSAFRLAGLKALEAEKAKALSSARGYLQRNRQDTASFGLDALTRVGAEYDLRKAQFEGAVGLEEINAHRTLLLDQADVLKSLLTQAMNELQLASGGGQAALNSIVQQRAAFDNLSALSSQALGEFAGAGLGSISNVFARSQQSEFNDRLLQILERSSGGGGGDIGTALAFSTLLSRQG